MSTWTQIVLTAFASVLASSGFWHFLDKRGNTKTSTKKLLLGIAYGKIVELAMRYIERGYISADEYEEFRNYLYEPYKAAGGNGVAERMMKDVSELPFRSPSKYSEIVRPS